jgi:DNA repair exonuclease SbcCD nuclease subunit
MILIRLETDDVGFVYDTDYHLSDVPPGRRAKGYREEVLGKVRHNNQLAHKIGAVRLCGGDLYHVKSARNVEANSHALQTRMEEEFLKAPLRTIFGVHGNHDIWMDRPDSIPSQPIGALIASGAFTDLSYGSVIFENRTGTIRVQVDAYPYLHDDMAALDRVLNAAPREAGVTYRIVLMHQYGNPGDEPQMFGKPIIGFNKMATCDYDLALWGHDHSRTETVTVGNCTHVRLGSLSRASLAGDEVERPVAAAIIRISEKGVKYKEHHVPVKPLEIAFTVGDREVVKMEESSALTDFFTAMDSAVADTETGNPREILYSLCPEDERHIADKACEVCAI